MINLIIFVFIFILSHIAFCKFTKVNSTYSLIFLFLILFLSFFDYSNLLNLNYCIFVFSSKLSFLLIYIEFFSLINRGFTISILTSVKAGQRVNEDDIENIYSGQKGLKWMLQKRINGMHLFRVLNKKNNDKFELLKFGEIVYILIKISKFIFNVKNLGR
jgi:hypothetical protein